MDRGGPGPAVCDAQSNRWRNAKVAVQRPVSAGAGKANRARAIRNAARPRWRRRIQRLDHVPAKGLRDRPRAVPVEGQDPTRNPLLPRGPGDVPSQGLGSSRASFPAGSAAGVGQAWLADRGHAASGTAGRSRQSAGRRSGRGPPSSGRPRRNPMSRCRKHDPLWHPGGGPHGQTGPRAGCPQGPEAPRSAGGRVRRRIGASERHPGSANRGRTRRPARRLRDGGRSRHPCPASRSVSGDAGGGHATPEGAKPTLFPAAVSNGNADAPFSSRRRPRKSAGPAAVGAA
ncbi:hypothetical protein C8N38_101545 [Rhodovulum kholense]|uniref:Uncharacterized protein n=1 Tax=Rhodovulum kholense TaxID=453584 RepID=A0A8E2VN97_9RHOB|nr:hypothetical protein C8N38_101545 [Rhodovulum kholense]